MSALASIVVLMPLESVDRSHAFFAMGRFGSSATYPAVYLTRDHWDKLGSPTRLKVTIEPDTGEVAP